MKRYLPVIAAAVAFVVYFLTTCRALWIGDSPEFALVLNSLGIAHPPGYPLFTILGTLFVQALAFLRPIFAGGIFCSLAAAAAVGVIFLILRRHLSDLTALGLSLIWAFTPIFWAETNGVEIYTLNVLLIALCFYALESRTPYRWPLTIYLFGLCLTNHPSALALAPALLYAFFTDREHTRPRRLPLYFALLLLAGSIYLYLWIRSLHNPATDWGNPEGLSALWQHMTLKQYSGWVGNSWDHVVFSLQLYARAVLDCWSWPGAILIVSGAGVGWNLARRRTVYALLILGMALFMAAFHQAVNHEPFFLPPLLASLLLIANNFLWLQRLKLPRPIWATAAIAAAVVLLALNYRDQDKSNYTLYEDYSRVLLEAAPDNSLLFVAGDINSFGPLYLQFAEGYRTNVEVYDRSVRKWPLIAQARRYSPTVGNDVLTARALLLASSPKRRFFAKSHYQNEPDWWEGLDSLHSYGLLYEFSPPIDRSRPVRAYPADFDPGDLMSRELLVNLDLIRGEEKLLLSPPDRVGAEADFRLAFRRYENEPRGLLLNQVGIFLRRIGMPDLALEAYTRGLAKPILAAGQRAEIRFNISNVYKDRGNAALQNQDFAAAAGEFERAAEFDPDNPRLLLNLALIYARQLNNSVKARAHLSRYLELEPNDAQARQLLNSLP